MSGKNQALTKEAKTEIWGEGPSTGEKAVTYQKSALFLLAFTCFYLLLLAFTCFYLLIPSMGVESLLSEVLADLKKTRPEDLDKEILRAAMIAELDAINIYEQMSNLTKSAEIRKVLLNIAREEKIHVAMFETVLLQADEEFLQVYIDYALARR